RGYCGCQDAPRTGAPRGYRTTRRYPCSHHRSAPRRDDTARRTERTSAPHPSWRPHCKAIDRVMAIDLAGIEARAREIRPVRRVRPDVRLQAHGVRLPDQLAALARDRAVEIVAGIDLKPGLIG